MKQILFFVLFFSVITSTAQNSTNVASDFKRLQIGCSFSQDINYRRLTTEYDYPNPDDAAHYVAFSAYNEKQVFEEKKISYTIGLNLSYHFSQHISIETGLRYSDKGYKSIERSYWNIFYTVYQSPVYAAMGNPAHESLIFSYHYVSIPCILRINGGQRKVRFTSGIGLSADIFLGRSVLVHRISYSVAGYEKKNVIINDKKNMVRVLDISPSISMGIIYRINDKMNLTIEPVFRYGLIKTEKHSLFNEHLWNLGINIGYYFGLR